MQRFSTPERPEQRRGIIPARKEYNASFLFAVLLGDGLVVTQS
jgi:hypothetical protein